MSECTSFNECRDKIVYRLISTTSNDVDLSLVPHILFLDLAIVFYVVTILDDEKVECFRITEEIKDIWGVSTGKLISCAKKNTPRLFPPIFKKLTDVISQALDLNDSEVQCMNEDIPLYVLSNKYLAYGSAAILYNESMDIISESLSENFYVIPSSTHEVLILPESDAISESYLKGLIRHVNEGFVNDEDVLSDSLYYYDQKEKRFYF